MVLFEAGGLVFLVLMAFWIWAIFDCIATDAGLCRNPPRASG
jgi:hypothetical protein